MDGRLLAMAPPRKRKRSPADAIRKDAHWYKLAVGQPCHEHVVAYGDTLRKNDTNRLSKNCARERIYRGHLLLTQSSALSQLERSGILYAELNATKTVIDTFVSRLSKDRPMPSFVTDGADWDLKRRARKFRQFIVGEMRETEFDDLSREALNDGSQLGTGWTRIDSGEDDVYAERIHDNDLFFDERECKYGKPRQAIHVHRIARDYLSELFPEHASQIEYARSSEPRPDDRSDNRLAETDLEDYVDVYEAWHLPSTRESHDGRRVMCIDGATLVTEEWLEARFPWAMFRLFRPPKGLRGDGFVDQLASLQHRVNCIVRDLQMNLAAFGKGYIAVHEANDMPTDMLTGWQPFKMKFRGAQPPKVELPQPFNPAQLSALQFFIQQMFEMSGVSMSAAQSKSSLGAGASGVALDTQYDIDSDRFRMPQANYARYRLDGAQAYLDAAARVARRRAEGKGKKRSWVATSWKSRDSIERLDYDEVALSDGDYKLQIEPVNFLPDTRAGKLSIVEQLAKAGVIPQWIVPTLFDEPDLQLANCFLLGPVRNCLRKMDVLADVRKEAPVPVAYNDLELELKVALGYYNYVEDDGAPDEVLDRYDTYIKLLEQLIKKKNVGAQPPAAAPGQEMAPPMPPEMGGVPAMPTGPLPIPTPIGAVA